MAQEFYEDSVFAQGAAPAARGVGLRAVAASLIALALLPVVAVAAVVWQFAPREAADLPYGLVAAALAASLVLYALLVVSLGLRLLVRPMRRLAAALGEIESGGYAGRMRRGAPGVREIDVLYRGLHLMWEGLERRRLQRDQALEASDAARAQLRAVLDQMDDAFFILDAKWSVGFCNRSAAHLLGLPDEALTHADFWRLFPDEPQQPGRIARCRREVGLGRAWCEEEWHERHGRWLEIRFFPSGVDIGVMVRDVSGQRQLHNELAERERRYRELFEANPNAMWIHDARTLKFLAVNDAAVALYGHTREAFLAMRTTDLQPAAERDRLADALKEEEGMAFLGSAPRIRRHVTRQGRSILAETTRHALVFQGCAAHLVMVADVTARMAAESRLRGRHLALTGELAQARADQRMLERLVQGMAGLVRQQPPRPAMRDAAPALPGALGGPPPEPPLAQSVRRVMRLLALRELAVAQEAVDLSALAGEAVTLLRLAEPQRRVHVEIEPGLACRGDAALLRDLLAELLANAWQSGHGRPAPWVRMGRVEGAPQRFFVSDNGCGFEAAEQARLFLPFERGGTVRGERSPGLGLALARAIVGRHHGRLWAESLPGRGSTFYFELSAMPAEEGPPQVREVVIDVADDWPHAPTGT